MKCFILGNGKSRNGVTVPLLQQRGTVYGCNAIYRDAAVDLLFARDPAMVAEIVENYTGKCIFTGSYTFSGGNALEYALSCNFSTLYLLGFDFANNGLYGSNIYGATHNYRAGGVKKAVADKWIAELKELIATATVPIYRVVNEYSASVDIGAIEIPMENFKNEICTV